MSVSRIVSILETPDAVYLVCSDNYYLFSSDGTCYRVLPDRIEAFWLYKNDFFVIERIKSNEHPIDVLSCCKEQYFFVVNSNSSLSIRNRMFEREVTLGVSSVSKFSNHEVIYYSHIHDCFEVYDFETMEIRQLLLSEHYLGLTSFLHDVITNCTYVDDNKTLRKIDWNDKTVTTIELDYDCLYDINNQTILYCKDNTVYLERTRIHTSVNVRCAKFDSHRIVILEPNKIIIYIYKKPEPLHVVDKTFTEYLLRLLNDSRADNQTDRVTISTPERDFIASKALIQRCSFFESLFRHDYIEKTNGIRIEVRASVMITILRYLERGETTVDFDDAYEVMLLADQYMLLELKEACERYLHL